MADRYGKPSSRYLALASVLIGVFLAADDQTVIVTILPQIMLDLKVQVNELDRASWTVTGYLLGYVAAMPLIGRMSDAWGRRRMYVASMLLFMVGSAAAAMTTSLSWLVAARVLQAIGAGALVPISIAIVGDLFPPEKRGLPLGLVGAAAEGGAVIGPLWGGLIGGLLDWPWVFWMNLPLGALTLAALWLWLRPSSGSGVRVDYLGGALLAASLCAITLALARVDTIDTLFAAYLAAGAATLALFVHRQMRVESPLLPLSMFRVRAFTAANWTHLLIGGSLLIGMITVTLMANTILGRGALDVGLMLMRMTLAIPVGAALGGLACQRMDCRIPSAVGLILIGVGFGLMSGWGTGAEDAIMTLHLATAGFGFGLLIAPVSLAAINSISEDLHGAGAAVVTAMRSVGMTFGLAALTAWGTARFEELIMGVQLPFSKPGETAEQSAARVQEFQDTLTNAGASVFSDFFLAAGFLALAALIPAAFMQWRRAKR